MITTRQQGTPCTFLCIESRKTYYACNVILFDLKNFYIGFIGILQRNNGTEEMVTD